ncbi:hypothetical protein D3C75_786840 [compost metagenome]
MLHVHRIGGNSLIEPAGSQLHRTAEIVHPDAVTGIGILCKQLQIGQIEDFAGFRFHIRIAPEDGFLRGFPDSVFTEPLLCLDFELQRRHTVQCNIQIVPAQNPGTEFPLRQHLAVSNNLVLQPFIHLI